MRGTSPRELSRHLHTLFHCGAVGQLSDSELVERFVAGRGEPAEAAFSALVHRHGAMVLGVCRRVLRNHDAAEDAFQATFLVLARKAAVIARREQLASWLYGVAHRAALDARARAARQKAKEKRLTPMVPVEPPDPCAARELSSILDEELADLPERYRSAIVLCELEGVSRRDAAARLGVSEGTLSSRLARAKVRLKDRLTRRGLALSAGALAAALADEARAVTVPPVLIDTTTRFAAMAAAGCSLAGVISTSVATLTEGVLKAMLIAKLKSVVLACASLAIVAAGVTAMAQSAGGGPPDDRLKAVEQKLDKLIELLSGSARPLQAPAPVTMPTPNIPPPLPAPAAEALPTPNMLPAPVPPPAPAAPALAGPPGATAGVAYQHYPPQAATPYPPPGGPHASPDALVKRVESLEHRLSELERRLGDLERSIRRTGSARMSPSAAPPDAGSIRDPFRPSFRRSRAGASSGPDPRNAPTRADVSSGAPSADTAPAASPSSEVPAADTAPAAAPSADNVPGAVEPADPAAPPPVGSVPESSGDRSQGGAES
jgi:RNA polymerase sigma factor (sigma-70 family)